MKRWIKLTAGLAGLTAAAAAGALSLRRARMRRAWRKDKAHLQRLTAKDRFDPAWLNGLPAPAQRYLRHAIAEGAPLARAATLEMTGRMKPRTTADFIELTAQELLAPPVGFQWTARFTLGPLPVWVRDHYYRNGGAVSIEPLGLPLQRSAGTDIARSSRHRLAGESVWLPSMLVPGPDVAWEGLGPHRARVTLTIDGEAIPLTLTVDDVGRLQHITMQRYGNEGVSDWQLIPYGFSIEDETTFGPYTIPTKIRGGWWFGTDRYDPDQASTFHIHATTFH